jgi:hypothetical protein
MQEKRRAQRCIQVVAHDDVLDGAVSLEPGIPVQNRGTL